MAAVVPASPVNPPAHQRGGKIYQYTITSTGVGGSLLAQVNVPTIVGSISNAFYVVDSVIPLIIRDNVGGDNTWPSQMGQSYSSAIKSILVVGIASQGTNGAPANPFTFTFKIWVGFDSHIGLIDHRVCFDSSEVEVIQASKAPVLILPGNIVVGLGEAPGAGVFTASRLGYVTVGLMISNLDASNPLYLMESTFTYIHMPLFASQVYRIPLTIDMNNPNPGFSITPDDNWVFTNAGTPEAVFIQNPNASNVTITIARIMKSKQYFIEKTSN